MRIECPAHGETEGYDVVSLRGKCKACNRAKLNANRQKHAMEPPEPSRFASDPWLTCNQPNCRKVCKDRHELYLHKRIQHSTTGVLEPEPKSLIQSQLGQR